MDREQQEEMDLCAVLNLVPYLDHDFLNNGPEMSLYEIAEEYGRNGPGEDSALLHQQAFTVLESFVRSHEELSKEIILVDQSHIERPGFEHASPIENDPADDLTQACTFRSGDGSFYVAYRGTGAGKWEDNGDGMTRPKTLMQEASRQYFDDMAEQYFEDAYRAGKRIVVTGHSKGGNEAQYVYMTSEYEYLISGCVNFDGQGFSARAVSEFRDRYGEDYARKISGITTVCGKNDFVHDLGNVIVPEENTYFVENSGSGPASMHMLEHMIGDEEGNYAPLDFSDENDGRGSQGAVGAFAKKMSENMMRLEEEDLHGSALALMAITDWAMNDMEKPETLGDAKADASDYIDLIAHGVPALLASLFLSKEGQGLMGELVRSGAEKWGPAGAAGIYTGTILLGAACLPQLTGILSKAVVTAKAADLMIDCVHAAGDASGRIFGVLSEGSSMFTAWAEGGLPDQSAKRAKRAGQGKSTGFGNFTEAFSGKSTAADLPGSIRADPDLLFSFAAQIRTLNGKLSELGGQLDGLFWESGIGPFREMLAPGARISWSPKLENCSLYLENTAQNLLNCERAIAGKAQSGG